jgi:hypothetical protein
VGVPGRAGSQGSETPPCPPDPCRASFASFWRRDNRCRRDCPREGDVLTIGAPREEAIRFQDCHPLPSLLGREVGEEERERERERGM